MYWLHRANVYVAVNAQLHFRGLLKLHSRYALQIAASCPTKPLGSFRANRQLHGWNPRPLVIYADSAPLNNGDANEDS